MLRTVILEKNGTYASFSISHEPAASYVGRFDARTEPPVHVNRFADAEEAEACLERSLSGSLDLGWRILWCGTNPAVWQMFRLPGHLAFVNLN